MVKIVQTYDVKEDIKDSNARRSSKGLKPITLDVLHTNQQHELAQHLKYDTAHRLLPKFRAAPRNTPAFMEDKETLDHA